MNPRKPSLTARMATPQQGLDEVILEGLAVSPFTERELCRALDESKQAVSHALNRLIVRRHVLIVRPPQWGSVLYGLTGRAI